MCEAPVQCPAAHVWGTHLPQTDKYIMSLVGPSALSSLVLPGPLCGFLSWDSFLGFLVFVLLSLGLPVPLFTPLFQDSVQIRHSPFLLRRVLASLGLFSLL